MKFCNLLYLREIVLYRAKKEKKITLSRIKRPRIGRILILNRPSSLRIRVHATSRVNQFENIAVFDNLSIIVDAAEAGRPKSVGRVYDGNFRSDFVWKAKIRRLIGDIIQLSN